MLECLRLFSSFEENRFKENYWSTPSTLHPEIFKKVKPKKETVEKLIT